MDINCVFDYSVHLFWMQFWNHGLCQNFTLYVLITWNACGKNVYNWMRPVDFMKFKLFCVYSPGCNTSGTSCTTSLGTFLHRGSQYLSQLLLLLWAWFSHWGWCRQASSMWSTMRYSGICFLRSYDFKPTVEMLCFVLFLICCWRCCCWCCCVLIS